MTEATWSRSDIAELAYLCWCPPLGLLGAHQFALGRYGWGALYLFTLGLLGVGWTFDLFHIPVLADYRARQLQQGRRNAQVDRNYSLIDAYKLCLPLGFLGLHHFYLGRRSWCLLYVCTLGLVGIGWAFDLLFLPWLVHRAKLVPPTSRSWRPTAYDIILTYLPLWGLLGGHHYYAGNYRIGIMYSLTLGGVGLAWLLDLFRLNQMLEKMQKDWDAANRQEQQNIGLDSVGNGEPVIGSTLSLARDNRNQASYDDAPPPYSVDILPQDLKHDDAKPASSFSQQASPMPTETSAVGRWSGPSAPDISYMHSSDQPESKSPHRGASTTCSICLDHTINCIYLDCGHSSTCEQCSMMLFQAGNRACPICRATCRELRRIYISGA